MWLVEHVLPSPHIMSCTNGLGLSRPLRNEYPLAHACRDRIDDLTFYLLNRNPTGEGDESPLVWWHVYPGHMVQVFLQKFPYMQGALERIQSLLLLKAKVLGVLDSIFVKVLEVQHAWIFCKQVFQSSLIGGMLLYESPPPEARNMV